ncbi:MAG: adenosylmethionine decarboxylase [Bacillota bacterium]
MLYQMGRQVLAELSFCDRAAVDDEAMVRRLLEQGARESGATLLSIHVHRFQPHGVSGVAILAESHLAVHTWPELGYAAVDAFTCGDHVDPRAAIAVLEKGPGARCNTTMELNRGMQPSIKAIAQIDSALHSQGEAQTGAAQTEGQPQA